MKKKLREAIWIKYDKHCAYCGKELEYSKMQVDHYFPKRNPMLAITYGVADVNAIENLMPSCRRCNHYKRGLLPDSFRKRMASLHERIVDIYIIKVAIDYGLVKITPFDNKFYFERYTKQEGAR